MFYMIYILTSPAAFPTFSADQPDVSHYMHLYTDYRVKSLLYLCLLFIVHCMGQLCEKLRPVHLKLWPLHHCFCSFRTQWRTIVTTCDYIQHWHYDNTRSLEIWDIYFLLAGIFCMCRFTQWATRLTVIQFHKKAVRCAMLPSASLGQGSTSVWKQQITLYIIIILIQ